MGINNYLENEVMSASPAKLVLMMYDGAINFLLNLEKLDWQKDCEKKGEFAGHDEGSGRGEKGQPVPG